MNHSLPCPTCSSDICFSFCSLFWCYMCTSNSSKAGSTWTEATAVRWKASGVYCCWRQDERFAGQHAFRRQFSHPSQLKLCGWECIFFPHFCIPVYHEQTDDMCCEWIVPYTKPLLMPIPNLSNLSEKNRRVVFWMNHTSHVSSFLNFMHGSVSYNFKSIDAVADMKHMKGGANHC